ncbi:MAG: hypothetical protein E6J22_09965 [Chloroflexi bacterium]|nr:MAG: hypothetical protein E6J22_09965 [Chloroflexota bacterium]
MYACSRFSLILCWIFSYVERSFAWAARFRRLARAYSRLPATLAGLHLAAFACSALAFHSSTSRP